MPANKYHVDGKRVPSVTTILGRSKSADGLIHWAWQCGADGLDYREVRQEAADVGTEVHDAIQSWLEGDDPVLSCAESGAAFEAFCKWWDEQGVEPIRHEVKLVSKLYGFGGQFDLLGGCDKGVVIFDWKSSKRIYDDMLAQLAAYAQLVTECEELPEPTWGCVVRLDKETGMPEHRFYDEEALNAGWQYFIAAHGLYEADKTLRKHA